MSQQQIDADFDEIESLLSKYSAPKVPIPEPKNEPTANQQPTAVTPEPKNEPGAVPAPAPIPESLQKPHDVPLSTMLGGVITKVGNMKPEPVANQSVGDTFMDTVKRVMGELSKMDRFSHLAEGAETVDTTLAIGQNIFKIITEGAVKILDVADEQVDEGKIVKGANGRMYKVVI